MLSQNADTEFVSAFLIVDYGARRYILTAMLHIHDYSTFVERLLDWFQKHRRPLPWRTTYTPYQVWVSEVMLQQTQMERGVTYFERWMKALPDIPSVAASSEDRLLKLWEGLGYYSRVRNLHKAAKQIVEKHGGTFPSTLSEIRALSGIGEYTAGAIASIAFEQDVPCVDANVERVFSRIFDIDTPVKQKENTLFIHKTAKALLPEGHARNWNQALMEFGALVCSRKPQCSVCPVQEWCEAYHLGIPHERPVSGKKVQYTHLDVATGVLLHGGKIYIQRRPEHGVWAGFWEFPGGCIEAGETPEQAVVREFEEEMEFLVTPVEKIAVINHGYTTYRVTLHCYFCVLAEGSPCEPVLHAATDFQWRTFAELDGATLPAGHRKLVDILRSDLRFEKYLQQ